MISFNSCEGTLRFGENNEGAVTVRPVDPEAEQSEHEPQEDVLGEEHSETESSGGSAPQLDRQLAASAPQVNRRRSWIGAQLAQLDRRARGIGAQLGQVDRRPGRPVSMQARTAT